MLSQPIDPHRRIRVSIAVMAALALHAVSLAIINRLIDLQLHREVKTIPVLLVSDRSIESKESIQSTQAETTSSQARDFATTSREKEYKVSASEGVEFSGSKTGQKRAQSSSESALPTIQMPEMSQSSRAQQAREGLQELFKRSGQVTPVEQKSTLQDAQLLSEYEQILWRSLSDHSLYDPYNEVLREQGMRELQFSIEIQLFPNGAIKRAKITESSGAQYIDDLAIKIVYDASPYPRTPASDIRKGFRDFFSVKFRPQ
ncbi:MAG: TonB C-terminal domain-containing protein [Oleiphilaceae bacterium]|nr:TonB C-terminal domain-containing protein [Oleiphilaceae bacterium]